MDATRGYSCRVSILSGYQHNFFPASLALSMAANADKLLQDNAHVLEQHSRKLKPPIHV